MPETKWFDSSKKMWEAITEEILKDLNKAMDDIMQAFENEVDRQLREGNFAPAKGKGAFYIGDLARTFTEELNYLEKSILYDAPHAEPIEFGTRPHFPPLQPLVEWAHIKLKLPYNGEAERAGYLIQQHIGKFGTLPRPFFRRSVAKITDNSFIVKILDKHFR